MGGRGKKKKGVGRLRIEENCVVGYEIKDS
jgi:hypothetical protein